MAHNGDTREDLRIRRTRKLLQQALVELVVEGDWAGLTVNDLAERAMVNRSTFYRHYLDKYALLEQFMDQVYGLTLEAEHSEGAGDAGAPPAGLIRLLEHVRQHAPFFRAMLGPRGDPLFASKIQQYIEQRYRLVLAAVPAAPAPGAPPLELSLQYISHAGIGIIVWWLANQHVAPEQVAAWIDSFSEADLGVALGGRNEPLR